MRGMKFDFVFSMGAMCACSSALRRNGLQFASYPFDWVLGSDPAGRSRMIASGFADWLRGSVLEKIEAPNNHEHDVYRNLTTGIVFVHDFPRNGNLHEALSAVKEKYERRTNRLQERIARSKRVLAVYINSPVYQPLTDDGLLLAHRILSERFPGVDFYLLGASCSKGRPFEKMLQRQVSERVFLYEYDYGARGPSIDDNAVERSEVDRLFALLRLSASDYRSADEKKRRAKVMRMKRYVRYGARSWLGYVVSRTEYRICRYFLKRLNARGVKVREGQ